MMLTSDGENIYV